MNLNRGKQGGEDRRDVQLDVGLLEGVARDALGKNIHPLLPEDIKRILDFMIKSRTSIVEQLGCVNSLVPLSVEMKSNPAPTKNQSTVSLIAVIASATS